MSFTHIIVPAVGLQAFEQGDTALGPFAPGSPWREAASERIQLHEDCLSMPFELAYARALGLPSDEGRIPWAAWETQTLGRACAWLHPCRLDVGMTDMVLQPTARLRLQDAESRQLHTLIAPYFEQDGIELRYHSASRWLALGEQFAEFECASLARVQGRSINAFLPHPGEFALQLKFSRLQAEMQMLLYTHPISEARLAQGLPAVNSFWIDGAGRLDTLPAPAKGTIELETRLQDAAHDSALYAQAWATLLQEWAELAAPSLAQRSEPHAAPRITLCGEVSAISLQAAKAGWKQRFSSLFGTQPASNLRKML